MYKRSVIVSTAQNFIGMSEADPEYKNKILEVYNQKPLPRGYALKPNDAWCAAFVSTVGILCGYDEIILKECSCQKMLEKYKKANRFIENDSYKPLPGDIIFYDWNDSGIGDCTGAPDHVGIVEKIEGKYITIIEGNYKNDEQPYIGLLFNEGVEASNKYCVPEITYNLNLYLYYCYLIMVSTYAIS